MIALKLSITASSLKTYKIHIHLRSSVSQLRPHLQASLAGRLPQFAVKGRQHNRMPYSFLPDPRGRPVDRVVSLQAVLPGQGFRW